MIGSDGYVDGYYRVGATNETTEGNANYGWVSKFNPFIRALPIIFPTQQLVANIEYVPHTGNWSADSLVIGPVDTSPPSNNPTLIHSPNPLPLPGSIYIIADVFESASANNIQINFNGGTLDGSFSDYVINNNNGVVAIMYIGEIPFYSNVPAWKILWEKT
jgi:hypothetical protein